MTRLSTLAAALALHVGCGLATDPVVAGTETTHQEAPMSARQVQINRHLLDADTLSRLEAALSPVPDGHYWYDAATGLWGTWGGPAQGVLQAGLALGGPLQADASGGHTGVFINGRQLHATEVAFLRQHGPVVPGRYWMNARFDVGWVNGPVIGNLAAAMSASHSSGSSIYRNSTTGTTVGSSGGTSHVSSSDGSGVILGD